MTGVVRRKKEVEGRRQKFIYEGDVTESSTCTRGNDACRNNPSTSLIRRKALRKDDVRVTEVNWLLETEQVSPMIGKSETGLVKRGGSHINKESLGRASGHR